MAGEKYTRNAISDIDFEQLVAAWLDGRLNAEQSEALQTELQDSSRARAKFREYAQLDARLHELADTSDMVRATQQIVDAMSVPGSESLESTSGDESTSDAVGRGSSVAQSRATLPPARIGTATSSNGRRTGFGRIASTRFSSWYTALAIAMLLAVSTFSYLNLSQNGSNAVRQTAASKEPVDVEITNVKLLRKPPAPVATLAAIKEALWEESQIEVGQALYEGELVSLLEGEARLSVGFGAEIIAAAPCSLTFLASDRIELHRGRVAVDVAPWAKGFTVVTEEMDVVDLGTTFTVSASPGVKSETTVLKGVVRVRPTNAQSKQRRGLLVTKGQRASVNDQGQLINIAKEESLQLLSALDFGGTGPYRPVALNNTGLGLSVGDEDMHWRVVAGPDKSFSSPEYASVCVPHDSYLPNDPQKSQWISIVDWKTAEPNSTYTFQTKFDLNGYDLSTMQLFGRFLADNGVSAVRVNGRSVEVQSWVDNVKFQPFRDQQFRFVNVTEGLVEGRNVIEVDVRNGMQRQWNAEHKAAKLSAILNPMALRVEWYAFGRQQQLVNTEGEARMLRRLKPSDFSLLTRSSVGPEI